MIDQSPVLQCAARRAASIGEDQKIEWSHSRRRFMKMCGTITGALLGAGFTGSARASSVIRIILVLPRLQQGAAPHPSAPEGDAFSGNSGNLTVTSALLESAARGVRLGIDEAERAGELLGRAVEFGTADEGPQALEMIRRLQPTGVIGGFDRDASLALSEAAAKAGSLFLNVGCRADVLRGPECRSNMYHVEAGQTMYEQALQTYVPKEPSNDIGVTLWHPDLFRYGAAQLNERFARRFGEGMDGQAWAGWMAVKVLWEAAIRSRSAETRDLSEYLLASGSRFDGHKGWPLSFCGSSRQLRQPLYITDAATGAVVGEVPLRDDTQPPQEQLDALIRTGDYPECRTTSSEK